MRDEPSLISMHPFVRAFVLNIIRTIKEKKFGGEKFVIDAEMVPKVSSSVMMASMGFGIVRPKLESKEKDVVVRRNMSELATPIERISRGPVRVVRTKMAPPVVMRPIEVKKVVPVVAVKSAVTEDGYGKITPLLNDTSISVIECQGKGKELMIVRAGQRQRTRIVLNSDDIANILEKIADEAHVPLIEGIFRASLSDFSINAVISKMVGSRFVIKKVTAYNLIE
jgi:hypothetical protein